MSTLRLQALGIIDACNTVLGARGKGDLPPVDVTTIQAAVTILEQAKKEVPADKVLAATKLEAAYTWIKILTAMQVVERSLPVPHAPHRQSFSARR
jgi:hypothetical protein